jgi:hypothetical protein
MGGRLIGYISNHIGLDDLFIPQQGQGKGKVGFVALMDMTSGVEDRGS